MPTNATPFLPKLLPYAPAGRTDRNGEPYRRFRVRIRGKDHYLGPWGPEGSPEHSRAVARYRELMADLIRNGEPSASPSRFTISDLIDRHLAELRRRDAATTPRGRSEANARSILNRLRGAFGSELVADFSSPKLVRWRRAMAETADVDGIRLSRGYINAKVIPTVVRMFGWGTDEGLCPREVHRDLSEVQPLARGSTSAPETEQRTAVDDAVVDATLPHLSWYARDVVELIRLTGARPSEICRLTPASLDRSDPEVWIADLAHHKTAHRGKVRVLSFDAEAQTILARHIDEHRPTFPIFTGGKLTDAKLQERHALRDSIPTPAQVAAIESSRAVRLADPKPLDPTTLQDQIRVACEEHGIGRWTLYQLRHAAATEAAERVGDTTAAAVLGNSEAIAKARYIHRQTEQARRARKELTAARARAV